MLEKYERRLAFQGTEIGYALLKTIYYLLFIALKNVFL